MQTIESDQPMATKERTRKGKRRRKVNTVGISIEEQRLRHLLFTGTSPSEAASKTGFSIGKAKEVMRELIDACAGPDSDGPYTVTQASVVLGLKLRRTRTLCEENRMGKKHGDRLYLVTRHDLERFGAKERRSGHPGVVARAEEIAAANGNGESK